MIIIKLRCKSRNEAVCAMCMASLRMCARWCCEVLSSLDALGAKARLRIPQGWSLRLALVCGCQVWIGQVDEAQEGLESLVEWTMAVPPFWVRQRSKWGLNSVKWGMSEGQRGWDGCGLVYLKYFLCRSSADLAEWQVVLAKEKSSRYQDKVSRG